MRTGPLFELEAPCFLRQGAFYLSALAVHADRHPQADKPWNSVLVLWSLVPCAVFLAYTGICSRDVLRSTELDVEGNMSKKAPIASGGLSTEAEVCLLQRLGGRGRCSWGQRTEGLAPCSGACDETRGAKTTGVEPGVYHVEGGTYWGPHTIFHGRSTEYRLYVRDLDHSSNLGCCELGPQSL